MLRSSIYDRSPHHCEAEGLQLPIHRIPRSVHRVRCFSIAHSMLRIGTGNDRDREMRNLPASDSITPIGRAPNLGRDLRTQR